jgi:ArsR family transcriptional regulator, repressor of sdpIR and other operons
MSAQEVFKALSDPSRRRILKILQSGSRTAGEIADGFEMTKGSLSHHFNVLKAADLVRCERRGQQIVYSLNTSVLEDAASLLMNLFGEKETEAGDEAPAR